MKFRILEIHDPKKNANNFFVQTGKTIWEKWFLFINKRVIVWEWVKIETEDINEQKAASYDTFEEALSIVEELKKQIPIYHEIR